MTLLPFFHIYGMVLILNLALYKGGTLVTIPRFELEQFLQIAQQYNNVMEKVVLVESKHKEDSKFQDLNTKLPKNISQFLLST